MNRIAALKDQVKCPACRGKGCNMCDYHGHVYKATAAFWRDGMKIIKEQIKKQKEQT